MHPFMEVIGSISQPAAEDVAENRVMDPGVHISGNYSSFNMGGNTEGRVIDLREAFQGIYAVPP